jgi:hypothetical protein
LIADAELSYAACAEAKLVELYSRNYRDRIASARKERDNKIARVEYNHIFVHSASVCLVVADTRAFFGTWRAAEQHGQRQPHAAKRRKG